jgi:hypothetical protein
VVPSSPDWIHEVKHDGFRLIVHRDGDRVRLLTRNGHDWSGRYPWIVEAAIDGVTDFNALWPLFHSRLSSGLKAKKSCIHQTHQPTLPVDVSF